MENLAFQSLPALAIANGATTPEPTHGQAWAWSTTLSKPVYWSGSQWVELPSGGGGGSLTTGSSEVNLTETINRLVVTGQTGITAISKVNAWIGVSTAENDSEAHILANAFLGVGVSDIVPGTGFTLNVVNEDDAFTGLFQVHWSY
jgi:hypothetical protein